MQRRRRAASQSSASEADIGEAPPVCSCARAETPRPVPPIVEPPVGSASDRGSRRSAAAGAGRPRHRSRSNRRPGNRRDRRAPIISSCSRCCSSRALQAGRNGAGRASGQALRAPCRSANGSSCAVAQGAPRLAIRVKKVIRLCTPESPMASRIPCRRAFAPSAIISVQSMGGAASSARSRSGRETATWQAASTGKRPDRAVHRGRSQARVRRKRRRIALQRRRAGAGSAPEQATAPMKGWSRMIRS